MTLQHHAVRVYAHTSAVTAGVVKSYQLLLERALILVRSARGTGDLTLRDQAQDIIAQIQHGMNLNLPAGIWLFEMLGIVWDALESQNKEHSRRAEDLLRQMRDLVVEVQKL